MSDLKQMVLTPWDWTPFSHQGCGQDILLQENTTDYKLIRLESICSVSNDG